MSGRSRLSPLPRNDPDPATARQAMSAVISVQVARSYAAVIHTLEGHPGLVIKCPARSGEAHLLHKEASSPTLRQSTLSRWWKVFES